MNTMNGYINELHEIMGSKMDDVVSIKDINNIDDEMLRGYIVYKLSLMIVYDFLKYTEADVLKITLDEYGVLATKYSTSTLVTIEILCGICRNNRTVPELLLLYSTVKSFLDRAPDATIEEKMKMHAEVVERAS